MKNIIRISCFILIHVACAMQQVQEQQPQFHEEVKELESIYVEHLVHQIHLAERQVSDEREARRYHHKKKLACIAFATSVAGGVTAIVVYMTK